MKEKVKLRKQKEVKAEISTKSSVYLPWVAALMVALLTVVFYLSVVNNEFVNWDDTEAIIDNHPIKFLNFSSLQWMFTTFHTGNWIPLTWFSIALDYAIGRLDPRVYHLHNLLLHVINSVLVFFLSLNILRCAIKSIEVRTKRLQQPEIWGAALAALQFALHPIHVESVAWATERKDLLCGVFFFASLLIYLNYATSDRGRTGKWWACFGLFALALLSKPMAITLPLVLLLLDIWPLNRFNLRNCLWEKVPFFILSLAISVVTIIAQSKAGAVSNTVVLPLDFRIMNAFHSLLFYVWKMLWPLDLVPFYPLTHQGTAAFSVANSVALIVVIFISAICFFYRKMRPYLGISWLYYVITLSPVLGVLQVGSQAAADRYSYIPSVSLLLLFSTFVVLLLYRHRLALACLSIAVVAVLGFATVQQIAIWKNSISLWESVVRVYPDVSFVAHTNLANAYKRSGQLDAALREFDRALAFPPPHHAYIYDGKGTVLLEKGFVDEAIQNFKQSIDIDPGYATPHRNLWFAYDKKGLHELAYAEVLEAVKINPEFAEAYNNLGISYGRKSQYEESIKAFTSALSLDPHNSMYLVNLATTYQKAGQLDRAIEWYKKGLMLNANEPVYFLNLANTYLLKGMLSEAIETLQAGTKLQPPVADIFQKLGVAYEKMGRKELAISNYEKAMRIRSTK